MTDAGAIREILATYKQHGWVLRRVLLSKTLEEKLGESKTTLFADVPQTPSEIDAAWFSRPPKSGGVAWEIRYLGDIPFALLETLDEGGAEFEDSLKTIESQLRETIMAKKSA